ncbi:MAG TPA: alanine--tRNA ligase, partial [Candidatus Obscuribacter sp.]|nr:alanine--tRNA ligase [Candidatus Obscuribacter sp.]
QKESTVTVIKEEEERFAKTIERGTSLLNDLLAAEGKTLAGEDVFNLYATYGFPVELTAEIALEHGKDIDMEGFARARTKHEEVSSVGKFNVIITGEEALGRVLKEHGATGFTGYGRLHDEGTILAILSQDGQLKPELTEGEEADIILSTTPFYGESGGQLGDTGWLKNEAGILQVLNTKKHEGLHIHRVRAVSGTLAEGDKVKAEVDGVRRKDTVLHHSSAHVFHAAVRQIFGKEVVQAGSQVGPAAMRFDFTLSKQPTRQELAKVEALMNEWVRTASPVKTTEMSIDEAKQTGAIAMFGEKYGERVRVVEMGDFSLEFCGGTHVNNTAEIGQIKIISEGSISQGVRRVEALSGEKAWNYISDQLRHLTEATDKLKIKPAELGAQIDRLQDNLKAREKQLQTLEEKLAMARIPELISQASQMGDTTVVAQAVQDISPASLKCVAENLKNRQGNLAVMLLATQPDGGVSLVTAFSQEMVKRGFNAGKIASEVAQILGGKGGGRPDLAQAGGKEAARLDEALSRFNQLVSKQLS